VAATPRGWYACTKLFVEGARRSFVEAHGMSAIAVRLGWCPRRRGSAREIAESPEDQDVYLSPADAGRFFAAPSRPPTASLGLLYATSRPVRRWTYDVEAAKRLIGYEPRDAWRRGPRSCSPADDATAASAGVSGRRAARAAKPGGRAA